MRWPWSKGKRKPETPDVAAELGRLKVDRERQKYHLLDRLAESDPRTAAAIAFGGARGALHTQPESELDKLAKYKAILGGGDDAWERMLKIREFMLQERKDLEDQYGPVDDASDSSPLERAVERFAPVALAGIAAWLNPQGYQQALAEQQQQPHQTQVTEVPRAAPPPQQPLPPEEPSMYVVPIPPETVLANLDGLAPAVFAQWALDQPSISERISKLADVPDDQLAQMLALAEANPFGEQDWKPVFHWLRGNPEKTQAIVAALRMMLSSSTDDEDAVGL